MNKYTKLLLTILGIVAVFVGIIFLYNGLIKDYKPKQNLVTNETTEEVAETTTEEEYNPFPITTTEVTTEETNENGDVKAADFTVVDIDEVPTTLSSKEGKPVVVNFWASWCSPCKAELPDFEQAYLDYGDDVEFMIVNLTNVSETVEKASEYINSQGYTFPVYYDVDQIANDAYGITSIPTTLFIDSEGYIVAYAQGMIDYDTIVQGIGMVTE